MDNQRYKNIILEALKEDGRLWNEEKTEFNQRLLFDLVDKIDETVIDLLLQKGETRDKFFVKVKDIYVFNTNEFKFFMEANKINNSYTEFINQIGLFDGTDLIKNKKEVVLNFPFKDCVLEGGQATEEGTDIYFEYDKKVTKTQEKQGYKAQAYNKKQSKRKEIFFNQVLAQDEIDRLFDDKAFVNWKRYTEDGEQKVSEIKRDETGLIKENLIIKGNNLLALHSLKKQFTGKIKCIYIDPPYYFEKSRSTDAFNYNSNFKLSTWLTFMKNRLEVASVLLKKDGVIFINIGDDGYAYLKILCDEIFRSENYVGTISWRKTDNQSNIGQFAKVTDYILIYAKEKPKLKLGRISLSEKAKKEYSYEDDKGKFRRLNIYDKTRGRYYYDIATPNGNVINGPWMIEEDEFKQLDIEDKVFWPEGGNATPYGKKYLHESEDGGQIPNDFWGIEFGTNQRGADEIEALFNMRAFEYPKPELLIYNILNIGSQENDIVLDFHLGSGTTCAVAHKMKRQYIGIEQMDYINDITVERLKKVIDNEQGGISNEVEWQGGGDFIYFELAKWNEQAKEKIFNCKDLEELISFFDVLCQKYFLNYNVKINEFKNKVICEKEFIDLPIEEQKRMFLTMLDLNQMYIQLTEMSDKRFGISIEDQESTKMFYGGE